jgi:hypothetical protein
LSPNTSSCQMKRLARRLRSRRPRHGDRR